MMRDSSSFKVRQMISTFQEKTMETSNTNLPARYHAAHVMLHWVIAFMNTFAALYHQFIVKDDLVAQVWFEVR